MLMLRQWLCKYESELGYDFAIEYHVGPKIYRAHCQGGYNMANATSASADASL